MLLAHAEISLRIGRIEPAARAAGQIFVAPGLLHGRGIDADLQAERVNRVDQSLHVGEFLVGLNGVDLAAPVAPLPAGVDVDVLIAEIGQPALVHYARRLENFVLRHGVGVGVPAGEAQQRRTERAVWLNAQHERLFRRAQPIFGTQTHGILALRGAPGQYAPFLVELHALGQMAGGDAHRPLAQERNAEQYRLFGRHAPDGGAGEQRRAFAGDTSGSEINTAHHSALLFVQR